MKNFLRFGFYSEKSLIGTKNWPAKAFSILVFVFAACYNLYFCQYGLDFSDTFFHLQNARHFMDGNPNQFFFLSDFIGYLFYKVFGNSVISFRLFDTLLLCLGIITPTFFCGKEFRSTSYFFLASVVLFILPSVKSSIFGYDTLTLFFITIFTFLTISYIKNNNILKLILLSILSALMIAIRFPNIIVIPIILLLNVFILNPFSKSKTNSLKILLVNSLIYLVGCIIIYCLLSLLVTGSLFFLLDANTTTSLSNSHSYRILFTRYIRDFITILKYSGIILGAYYLYIFLNQITKKLLFKLLLLLSTICAYLFLIHFDVLYTSYHWNLILFLSSIYISIFFLILTNLKQFEKKGIAILTLLILIGFVPAFGSNTGLLKTTISFCLVPFLLINYKNYYRTYFIILLLTIIPLSIIEINIISYEDSPKRLLISEFNNSELKHIKSTPLRVDFINEINNKYNLIDDNKTVIFYGKNAHVFNYLLNLKNPFQTFWMKLEDTNEALILEKSIIKESPIIFLVPNYPEETINKQRIYNSLVYEIMSKYLYSFEFHESYVICKPID